MTDNKELNPFPGAARTDLPAHVNAGSVVIESQRAVQEAKGKIEVARAFPRSLSRCIEEFMESCKSPEFAGEAFYALPRGGKQVTGKSIRFAEEAARCYGHMEWGHRELSRTAERSEILVYAYDIEKNNTSTRQITVEHVMDTKQGPQKLRYQTDIDNKIANVGSKQVRERILALLPKPLVAAGEAMCKQTLAGGNEESVTTRVRKMTDAFSKYGVRIEHIEGRLGYSLDYATTDDLADMAAVYSALRGGEKVSDYFDSPNSEAKETQAVPEETGKSQLGKAAADAAKKTDKPKASGGKKAEPKAETVTEPEPEQKPVDTDAKVADTGAQQDDDLDLWDE